MTITTLPSVFTIAISLPLLLLPACQRQKTVNNDTESAAVITVTDTQRYTYGRVHGPEIDYTQSISEYIPSVFQDSRGRMWFGTLGEGVAMSDGNRLTYFTPNNGFGAETVRDIAEDAYGNIWFATTEGVSRYNGTSFTNYAAQDGLPHKQAWCLLIDNTGKIWVGTEGGLCWFDGKRFQKFDLPLAPIEIKKDVYPAHLLVNGICQDREGNIWFATNGNGVFKYDGKTLQQFTTENGLASNFVQAVVEDKYGNLWFGTLYGGISKFDGERFTNFTEADGLATNHVWTVFEDRDGNIWLADRAGALRYDSRTFTRFGEEQGMHNRHVQSMIQDKRGTIWFGTSGGVYRYDGKTLAPYTKSDAMLKGC